MIRPMFPAARCFVPLHPQPHAATVPCRRAPAATTVAAKPRRWTRGPRRDRSWDDDGGSDSDADDGFFGQEPDDGDDEPEREEPAPGRSASPSAARPAGGQLRGSDVLRALQRASAAKEAARRKKDKRPAPRRGREKPVGGDAEEAGEVRPVVIRPEWAARIRELEGRVQQLADKYHHHQ